LNDNHLAEDVVQETFLLAINNFHQLKDEAKINIHSGLLGMEGLHGKTARGGK